MWHSHNHAAWFLCHGECLYGGPSSLKLRQFTTSGLNHGSQDSASSQPTSQGQLVSEDHWRASQDALHRGVKAVQSKNREMSSGEASRFAASASWLVGSWPGLQDILIYHCFLSGYSLHLHVHIEFQSKVPRLLCNGYSSHWPVFTQWLVSICWFSQHWSRHMTCLGQWNESRGDVPLFRREAFNFWYRKTLFLACFALLCFAIFFFFDKLKVCGNPASSKSVATTFPTAFSHFVSLCHILVILAILQTFSFLSYLLWWSVISDLWCYYYNCFGEPQTTPL